MKLSTIDLHADRHWRSATGLDQKRFDKLLALLPAAYLQIYGKSIQERQRDYPHEPTLNTYEDLLLFTLFSLKSGEYRGTVRKWGTHDYAYPIFCDMMLPI